MNKTLPQLAASTIALAGLLFGVAAQATNLAELPLKASVLAKPNVVFGMDDSGSMDWEVLLDTSSGVVWWSGASAWDTVNNRPLQSSNNPPMVYLFPNGTALGGQIYAYNDWYGQTAPPTAQFAWLRSHAFNPLYYNPATTYPRWSEANLGTSSVNTTFPNATPTAARLHPVTTTSPTLNLTVAWDNANANFTSTTGGYRFYVQGGMRLPAGTVVGTNGSDATACQGNNVRTLAAEVTVPGNAACWASIPFFPATYWERSTACAVGPDCVAAPDGNGFLQRREIRPANYTTPAEYTAAIQNFANWFTYYRKRKLMLAGSMGRALETVTGMRMNVVPFYKDDRTALTTMFDADSTSNLNNRFRVAGRFYNNALAPRGTPTHDAMLYIGNQIAAQRTEATNDKSVVQFACQRNAMFVVTDGFANSPGSISVPSISNSALTKYGSTSPYATTFEDSLAEIALAYYANPMRTDLTAGQVPIAQKSADKPNADENPNLHINTYAISLGVRGSIWPRLFSPGGEVPGSQDPFVAAPNWPVPVGDNPTMLDDLYHATINGRGQMYLADDVNRLSQSIQSAFDDILTQNATQGGSSISSVNLDNTEGSAAYAGAYDPAGWTGDVTKSAIDKFTGGVASSFDWSAATLLDARTTPRKIFTGTGTTGGWEFEASVGEVTALINPGGVYGSNADLIDYLRGNRSLETSQYRRRLSLMGPVVNSVPTYDNVTKMVYVASGEGMLHALNAENGQEEWAYVPYDTLKGTETDAAKYNGIGSTAARSYVYKTKLDATVAVAKVDSSTRMLVGGMGAAGRAYYGIDVTNPKGLDQSAAKSQARWTFPRNGDAARNLMGYTVGTPIIVKTVDGKQVALVTSGYDNGESIGDGKGRMWALDAKTGEPVDIGAGNAGVFVTTDGSAGAEAGLAHISAFAEVDGSVRYVYGGDLLGNLWRFDLKKGSPLPVLKVTQFIRGGQVQPVMAAPALVRYKGKRIIMVGTGRLLDVTDFGNSDVQSFYAIADSTTDTTLAAADLRNNLVARTYTRGNDPELSGASINWDTKRGWYFDLPAGEKANTRPTVGFNTVGFATNKNGGNDCTASSYLYIVDVASGSQSLDVGYTSTVISSKANTTGATFVKLKDGSLRAVGDVFEEKAGDDGGGGGGPKKCSKIGLHWVCPGEGGKLLQPSRNAWREVVR